MSSLEFVDDCDFLGIIFPVVTFVKHFRIELSAHVLAIYQMPEKRREIFFFLSLRRFVVLSESPCSFWPQPFDCLHLGFYTWVVMALEFPTFQFRPLCSGDCIR